MGSAAIYYAPEGFDTSGHKLMGRHAAGEGFLRAFCRHAAAPEIFCYAANEAHFQDFQKKFGHLSARKTLFINTAEPNTLAKAGNVFYPSPGIDGMAWLRRRFGQKLFGLTGITHTTASDRVMDSIANLLTAPVQPWDAVICTSSVVRKTFEHILSTHGEYLKERLGLTAAPRSPVMLPVIPLGVDVAQFATGEQKNQQRKTWRDKLGIAEGDIAVLYMGRLSFHAKAHPFPMYMALENAAHQTGRKLHLIQAGWFFNEHIEKSFKVAAAEVCPSVNAIFLDGRVKEVREQIWSAGDIFCSLSDNIQETFGLTPIEAMAAGLPQVVSDWDGYKDTVRDGIDGFRVPTVMANPGSGEQFSFRYESEIDNYDIYCANAGLAVAVDIPATTKAFVELIGNADLRSKMSENGKNRADEVYDWKQVIKLYEELWQEQNQRREDAAEIAPRVATAPANPTRDDPFILFESYPTAFLGDSSHFKLQFKEPLKLVAKLRGMAVSNYGTAFDGEVIKKLLEIITRTPDVSLAQLKSAFPHDSHTRLEVNLLWLLKFGVIVKVG